MLHKVRDLPIETRGVVESLIGRRLREDETFSIRPMHLQKEGAEPQVAGEVANRLEKYFAEVDAQYPIPPEGEAEAALDEAMRSIRSGYTPHR